MPDTFPYAPADTVDNVTPANAALVNPILHWLEYGTDVIPAFKVDPSNAKAYATVAAAYAAADAGLAAGLPALIELAHGVSHAGVDLTLNPLRSCVIKAAGDAQGQPYDPIGTVLAIDITAPNADAAASRRLLTLQGVSLTGDITAGSNWKVILDNVEWYLGGLSRTHGTNGCQFIATDSVMYDDFSIADADVASGASAASASFVRSTIGSVMLGANIMTFLGPVNVTVRASLISMYGAMGGALFSLNNAASAISIDASSTINAYDYGAAPALFTGHSNTSVSWSGATVKGVGGSSIDLGGSSGTHTFPPRFLGTVAPTNPPSGTVYENPSNKQVKTYVYHASYPYWKSSSWKDNEAYVDPSVGDATASTGAFSTVNQAYNALNANVTANYSLIIRLAWKVAHTLSR